MQLKTNVDSYIVPSSALEFCDISDAIKDTHIKIVRFLLTVALMFDDTISISLYLKAPQPIVESVGD